MKRVLASAALLASSFVVAHSASAASVTTWTTGSTGSAASVSFLTADGVTIAATGMNSVLGSALVNERPDGLGVQSSNAGDRFHIDGGGVGQETLWLNFSSDYKLKGIFLSHADLDDKVTLVGEAGVLGTYSIAPIHQKYDLAYLDLTSLNLSTNKIGFYAAGSGDEFLVKGVKGHAVPTPSAALAGLVGLIGLAARRRRNVELA